MYVKKSCANCSGTGKVFDFWNPATWIPFNYSVRPIIDCPRCNGRGYVLTVWKDRRKDWR